MSVGTEPTLRPTAGSVPDEPPTPPTPGREPSAATVLSEYFEQQVGMIRSLEAGVRADLPDAVHQMRIACRRLRSALRVYRSLLVAERTEPLRRELAWLGGMLAGPRDAEVLKQRLGDSLRELPADAVVGPVAERMATELDARHHTAHAALVEALDGPRHRALLVCLSGLLDEPPFQALADAPAAKVLPHQLGKAVARVSRRWAAACAASGEEQVVLAHEARKKAKAARYAWEVAVPAIPTGERAVKAWKQVTESLGVAQDTVVAREALLELSAVAQAAGEPGFTYGVLYGRELAHQDDARGVADRAVRIARRASRIH